MEVYESLRLPTDAIEVFSRTSLMNSCQYREIMYTNKRGSFTEHHVEQLAQRCDQRTPYLAARMWQNRSRDVQGTLMYFPSSIRTRPESCGISAIKI